MPRNHDGWKVEYAADLAEELRREDAYRRKMEDYQFKHGNDPQYELPHDEEEESQ
jgi:hypothetical protein